MASTTQQLNTESQGSSALPTDPTYDSTSPAILHCTPLVLRMGEIFGDFGVQLANRSTQNRFSKWQLQVLLEGVPEPVYDEELPIAQANKVLKLKPSTAYLVRTRVFSELVTSWGPWSELSRTMTFSPVFASVNEIGEDYVRMIWDRPVRETSKIVPEADRTATEAVANISQFELRVVREVDMAQEFCDEFPVGVRTYTLHELRPATAYIIFIRYQTLIGTKKQWSEVCRFYTQASHTTTLTRRGEDCFTVSWARAPLADNTVGYLLPDSTIHKFEVSVEGEGADGTPIELAASTKEYTAKSLCPGSEYLFRIRALSKEGRWGARAKPLAVHTAERPQLVPLSLGESFMSLGWSRRVFETNESKVECEISTASNSYRRSLALNVGLDEKDKVLHADGLNSGTEYLVSIRTFLDGEWGLWTEPKRIRTVPKASLIFVERGEDFLTVDWALGNNLSDEERSVASVDSRFLVVVTRVDADGERHAILEHEVNRTASSEGLRIGSLQPDTQYEIRCKAWQRNRLTAFEGWGELSAPIIAQTLQSVALQVLDMGEDYAQLSWRRALRTEPTKSNTGATTQWLDLKYELIVGCLDTGDDSVMHREVLDTTYTISNLLPNTCYIVSVRACDEKEQWGLWCRVTFRTLAAVKSTIHEIGEDFVRLMWQRHESTNDRPLSPVSQQGAVHHSGPKTSEQYVSQYAIFVFSVDFKESEVMHKDSGYYRGGDSEVAMLEYVASHHSSCRIGNLLPDREYIAVVRALTTSGKWGLWCNPLRFRTVPQFRIPVNFLSIGENYVNIVWSREEHPVVDKDVVLGDFTVVGQQLRIHGVDTPYSKDHNLGADLRELKLYGLSPTTAYSIQIRACGKSGEWGLWSAPVHILTRATITTRPVEVAEDYVVVSWERKKAANPKNYPTGKGLVTSYHLRVSNAKGICSETFLGDGDCPYRITGLHPDTYYCVELKANYNDEEWGLWSTPLWCLTMRHLEVRAQLISEEFCNVKIVRPLQHRRLPEDDGNRATEDRVIAFGQLRSHCMLCVTSPQTTPMPHTSGGGAVARRSVSHSTLPADCQDHRLVYQIELVSEQEETLHTIPGLKANTIYHAAVRSKLDSGEWGMWSIPSLRFATVPTIVVGFAAIGENYITVDWKRGQQNIPQGLGSKIQCGLGIITKSKLKLRDLSTNSQPRTYDIESSATQLYIDSLAPSSTYAVAVQTFNDNHEWGMWSEEYKVRTVPSMAIHVEHITEDAVWVSWIRQPDIDKPVSHDTALNVDALVRNYEVKIVGDGHFCFQRELEGNRLFFRGLQPDTVYEFKVRSLSKNDGHWGLWSSQLFRTQPMMRVTFGNIGEHFAVVEWRRHLPTAFASDANLPIAEAEDLVQEFRLKVEKVGEEAVYYELSPHISSFRLTELQPSSEYRVWMCAKGHEGVWGLWNQEARVRTLPQLDLKIQDIGEDYLTVTWSRLKWSGERAAEIPGVKVWEIDGAVSGYHLKVLDAEGNIFAQNHCNYTQTKLTISHLNLRSVYSVQVCAKDTYDEWGLWSESQRFITLQPVKMNLLRIGEDHVHIEWGRRGQLRRRLAPDHRVEEVEDEANVEDEAGGLDSGEEGENNAGSDGSQNLDDMDHNSDDAFSMDDNEDDIIHGNENVKQWHVRVYGSRVFGGQPGAEDYVEFFTDSSVTFYNICNLLPKATYSITVRAQNMSAEWGHWCHAENVVTLPLLVTSSEYIGETFMTLSWHRPEATEHSYLVCFPPPTGIHNYQVQIKPLTSEQQFDAEDEPLVNGARVYETTQPSLQLSNLNPGTRYRVVVREEMIDPTDPNVRPLVPEFGVASEALIVETIEATAVEPVEIGENYASVSWGRKKRQQESEGGAALTVVRSTAKVTSYEIQAFRMDDIAENVYKGPLALELTKTFNASTQSFELSNLVPNGIYAVAARAQTEGGHWGLWSSPSKFITQKRLTVHVELINEDSFVISWARAMPDWAASAIPMLGSHASQQDIEVASSIAGDDMDGEGEDEAATEPNTPPPPVNPALESVIIGDYSVHLYEVVVEGINHSFTQRLILPNGKISTRINGLAANTIYSVSVRSTTAQEVWSLFSPKVSICTLKGMELAINHYFENYIALSWQRQAQAITEHSKYLTKLKDNITREAEQKERKELFEMEQIRIQQEALGEGNEDASFVERTRELEHYMVAVQEMVYCLTPENVHLGKSDVTGYQLQLYGSGGTPFIVGTSHVLQTAKRRSKKKGVARQPSLLPSNKNPTSAAMAANKAQTIQAKMKQATVTQQQETNKPQDDDVLDPNAMSTDETMLLDAKINPKTHSVTILGLQENTCYEFSVRARNLYQEWGPWSPRKDVTTLGLIQLHHTRFGEHYINLFWHRLSQAEQQERAEKERCLKEFAQEFKDLTPKELELKKETMDAETYNAFIGRLKEWKQLQRAVTKFDAGLSEGFGAVTSAPQTPIKGYHLRIVQENGAIKDRYFPDTGDQGHQFTVTGLQPNTMYVAMLCADYGLGEWGTWTEQIRFMTQNLIQLQLSYVGESFIDIEWRRASNKKLPKGDEGLVLLNPTAQGRGHQYEVSIRSKDPDSGEEFDDRRPMNDCSVFRIDRLKTDTKYQVSVREWDAKGEWGLWSGVRTCCTLAGMQTTIHEIGESWVHLSWARQIRRRIQEEGNQQVVQLPVETVAFYLRVEELEDNGLHSKDTSNQEQCLDAEPDKLDDPLEDSHEEDFSALLNRSGEVSEGESNLGPLPSPEPPKEREPYADGSTRYIYVKKFNFDTNEIRIDTLRPDTFYNIQVLCETTGSQLGTWSGDKYMLSLSKIRLRTDLVDEQAVRLSWTREAPRTHPRLHAPVATGNFQTAQFELEAFGNEKKHAKYHLLQNFAKGVLEHKLSDLMVNCSYGVRVRASDTQDRFSLWSDTLYFATLKPLRVIAAKILEHQAYVEWGRENQHASEYPPTETPINFGQERANQYHLRVYTPNERTVPLLDKQFPGAIAKYQLTNLAPNSCYIVQARSCNVIGEWGLWSEDRVVYTMKLVELDVSAVGEDYIKVTWKRDEPDELQEMVHIDRHALEEIDEEEFTDENQTKMLLIKKRYPLLDRPVEKGHIYSSVRTNITKYTLSITKRGETEDIVIEVPATAAASIRSGVSTWTVSKLRPDTQYSVAIRAFYGEEDWGLWSERVVSGTTNLLAVDIKYIGEDYLSATWQRAVTSYPNLTELRLGKSEETLCYEFLMHDFSEVPIGEEAAADLDTTFVRDVLVAKLKVATVKNLRSNRRYRMCVRRWYRPIECPTIVPLIEDGETPLSEEQRLRFFMEQNHGTPGTWSDHVFAITLKDMVALVDDIAEDSLQIRWDRDPNAAVLPTRHCVRVTTVTQSYHVRIDAMTYDGSAVDNSLNTLHLDHVFGPEETNYKVPDLQPDSVYKIDVRCCTDKVWGQWSKTLYVVTLPKLFINIQSIGEDYISINWERRIRQLTLADGSLAVVGNTNNVEKYHLDMTGVDHHFRLEKKFKSTRTSYRVKHLEAQTVYHISIRSCDIQTGAWSLWSEPVVFATLRPMSLTLGKSGEQFVHVTWERPAQLPEEYAHIDPNIQLGRTSVMSYHLCVFAMDQAPATAVVDKQFHGEVTKYRITTLTPNTSYIIIVRACNDESQWGLWSEERIIRTQRILTLQINGIGENYVTCRWEREEGDNSEVVNDATQGQPCSFHLAITSETETVDRHFNIEECQISKDEFHLPQYSTRGLSPDTKYIMALQPCYGSDEWGLWTKPITFVTLNRISIMTTSVTENKVELAWGRAQQNVELAADPNIVTWRGTIVKYQLLMRKVDEMNAAARRERERAAMTMVEPDPDPTVEGLAPMIKENGEGENNGAVTAKDGQPSDATRKSPVDSTLAVATVAETEGGAATAGAATGDSAADKRRQSLVQEPDELRIEREMDVKQVKYVQTSCTIDSLQLNTDYHVQVRALDDANEWGCWTELMFDTPPPPPINPQVRKSGAQYCIVSWEAPDVINRYSYVVEQALVRESTTRRGKMDVTDWKVVDTVEEPQCRVRAFGPLNKIRYRIKCCKIDRPTHIFSQYSDTVGLSTTNPPEPVSSIVVATLSRNTATIEWTKASTSPTQEAGDTPQPSKQCAFRILLSIREAPPVLLATTRNTTYTLADLEPNTSYKVQVQVETENGVSQRNVIIKFTTKADSDRTVSRAQAGQPPLGTIVSRPGTQEGPTGQETVRLPTIAQVMPTPEKKTSPRGGLKKATKGSALAPKPPQDGPLGGAKRPTPLAGGGKRGTSPKITSPTKRNTSTSPTKKRASPPPTKPSNPRPQEHPLPPVRSRQGAPNGAKGPVEQYDFVGFNHSDDEAS